MTFIEIWNLIVEERDKNINANERVVQSSWENFFSDFFGYKKSFGDIDAQRNIPIGSREREIPDIVLKREGKDLCDVELKQYSYDFIMDMQNQLISYLNQLHLSIGVLVCKSLYLYSYNYVEEKIKRVEIKFTKDNPDGVKFVELFQKENFNSAKIGAFIDSKLSFSENVEKIKKEITSDNILFLLEDYFSSAYTEEEIKEALKDVEIKICDKKNVVCVGEETKTSSKSTIGMDYTRYNFEGKSYGKNRLVLAVVSAYIRDNPSATYEYLKGVFNDGLQGSTGVIATPIEARNKRRDAEKRFFVKDALYLKDGKEIWVCTQWGVGNIDRFIEKVTSLGYIIKKI